MENKKISGFDYLWCSLYACAGFAFEFVLTVIESALGINPQEFTPTQSVIHWLCTAAGWFLIGALVIFIGKKTTGYNISPNGEKMRLWQYAALAVCFAVNAAAKYIEWDGFKILIEWNSKTPPMFLFQYIYYIAEGFLISLVIVYGQKAFETWFGNEKIPYGGIVLELVWGLAHIFTQGSVPIGLLSALAGFLFGASYLLVNKDFRKAFPVITLLFLL